jgi:ribonuclease R
MFIIEEKVRKPEGEVIEVLERNKTDFVGVIDIQKNSFVSTATKNVYRYLYSKR